uniref:Uncharacterized protein n=1 Tax=Arundo donax TaxID=35708 RepID=A0A0A9BVM9_ARUDO
MRFREHKCARKSCKFRSFR